MESLSKIEDNGQLSIVDGMIDWVRVIDKNNTILYANQKMKEELGENLVGMKCYEIFNKSKKCEECISKETLINGKILKKETVFKGRIYTVISSPVVNKNKEIIASVEVFRDMTKEKQLSDSLSEKNKKMSDDIDFARNMQKRMLPPKGMYNGVSIDYLYEPSEFLSGDFFDIFQIDMDITGIYICDVVGHGVTASLLTIFVRQSLRIIAKTYNSVDLIISELHKTFLGLNLDYDKYFSIFFGMYNKNTHKFVYINAGHNSVPVMVRDNTIIMLEAKGYPICNIFEDVSYDVNTIELQVDDKLFFYTDGITESKNSNKEEFGTENLINIIKSEKNILNNIKETLNEYSVYQKDDYAILMVEII